MFHIQLRQFPHKACHFNMTDQELLALMGPWVLEQWIEVGERKWNPHQAQLTIVEGPHLEVEDLSMGRGWPSAQHRGKDVTEQVLEQVKASLQTPQGAGPQGAGPQGAGPRGAGPRGAGPRGAGPRGDVPAATHSAPPAPAPRSMMDPSPRSPARSPARSWARSSGHCWATIPRGCCRPGVSPPGDGPSSPRASVWRWPKRPSGRWVLARTEAPLDSVCLTWWA